MLHNLSSYIDYTVAFKFTLKAFLLTYIDYTMAFKFTSKAFLLTLKAFFIDPEGPF